MNLLKQCGVPMVCASVGVLCALMACGMTACFPASELSEDEDPQTQQTGELHQLSGVTRAAASAAIEAPIRIFALSNGVLADSTTVMSTTEAWTLHVANGDWTVAAMSAWPYYYGSKEIGVDGNTETSIIVSPAVASVDFSLSGMHTDAVTVEMDNLYATLKPTGKYSGTATRQIPLTLNDTAWVADTYALPSRSNLTLYITYNDSTFAYYHDEPLIAGYRYHFRGHYDAGSAIHGWIIVGDWLGEKEVDFTWGARHPSATEDEKDKGEGNNGDYSADLLITSARIFTDVHSALNTEGYAGEAANKAETYSESGHPAGTWRIPTKDEARALRNAHPDPSATVRYLCEDGTYTFTFAPGSSITKAGTKATYSLILVTDL